MKTRNYATHCYFGHEKVVRGQQRVCLVCKRDRARDAYHKKHGSPLTKAQKLRIAGAVAPSLRTKTAHRRVNVTNAAGEVIAKDKPLDEYQRGILRTHDVVFGVVEDARPSQILCRVCTKPIKIPRVGKISPTCPRGCDLHCSICRREVSVRAAVRAARNAVKPKCKKCALKGRVFSAEARERMREAAKRRGFQQAADGTFVRPGRAA
jgi:hypothetical protein